MLISFFIIIIIIIFFFPAYRFYDRGHVQRWKASSEPLLFAKRLLAGACYSRHNQGVGYINKINICASSRRGKREKGEKKKKRVLRVPIKVGERVCVGRTHLRRGKLEIYPETGLSAAGWRRGWQNWARKGRSRLQPSRSTC